MDGRRTSKPSYNYRHRQQHQFFFFLLQSATILLQSATGITKYDRTESLTNSRGSRVQSRGRGSIVAAGENDLEFEVTAE